ncbi:hypothetical protein [Streptomyces sp. NPDC051994]|uniref:hypothetical protein n=1 Tax=unclassified Streptomyces TaxID=2593676 RepID=UPI00341285ED
MLPDDGFFPLRYTRDAPPARIHVHHHGRKGEPKGFQEKDFARLLGVAHRQLGGNTVVL